RSGTLTFAGKISGTGAVHQIGSGVTVLTGENTYAGGTEISAGTLQLGDGGTAGSIVGDVLNDGTLTFNRSGTLTFAGKISGTGAVHQIGSGVTVLTGENTYAGGTEISAGTLQLGDGGTAGSIVGDVLNDGTLTFNRSGTLTFAGKIFGTGAVHQIGSGVTVLTGENTYAGGTEISAGTLQLGDGGTAGSIVGDVLNDGTLTFNRSGTLTFAGKISGTGAVHQIGSGVTVLTGENTYAGGTEISAGTLRAGGANVFSAASAHSVLAGGTLDLNSFDQTLVSLNNAGLVRLNGAPGTALAVTGNYSGNGGTLVVNTALHGDASPTDRLFANTTSGSSRLQVNNVGGTGARTTEGIKVVDVGNPGASTGLFTLQGDFVLDGEQAVVGGAYAYVLQQDGVSTPGDGDWYLRSSLTNPPPNPPSPIPPGPLYQPGVPLYEIYGQVLLDLARLPTMQQRVGNRYWGGDDAMMAAHTAAAASYVSLGASASARDVAPDNQPLLWTRIEGRHGKFNPTTTAGSRYEADQVALQSGLDGLLLENDSGRLIAGVNGQYGNVSARARSVWGNGKIAVDGYSFGGTLTWYGHEGFYVDGQAQVTWFDSKLTSDIVAGEVAKDDEGFAHAFSVEGGKRVALGGGWSLTPQSQLSYASVSADFNDRFGAHVTLDDAESLLGRVGLAADYRNAWLDGSEQIVRTSVYGIANLYYEFLDGTRANVSGTSFVSANERLWGDVGLGGTYNWANDRYALYGEVSVNTSMKDLGDSYSVNGTAGFRMKW
ncbi:autotransporter outer membrane beta-barrel domain-containing protein, partial [Phyllobacterium salinisoli]